MEYKHIIIHFIIGVIGVLLLCVGCYLSDSLDIEDDIAIPMIGDFVGYIIYTMIKLYKKGDH